MKKLIIVGELKLDGFKYRDQDKGGNDQIKYGIWLKGKIMEDQTRIKMGKINGYQGKTHMYH